MRFWERQREARRSTRWLLLVFGLCVLAVVASVHLGLMLAWWLGTLAFGGWDYPTGFATVNICVTLLLVLGGCLIELDQLRHGGRKLAQRVGAREARAGSSLAEQQLCNIVHEMCIAAHWPAPQVAVLARVLRGGQPDPVGITEFCQTVRPSARDVTENWTTKANRKETDDEKEDDY